ncbi:hypothetical protein CVV65_13390 [Kyrpidia spormannii]|uniref:Uncharacterized protein n=1 Tax=Kyrpidia spormannii TaxID=2055160 RepID=A0A2K8NAG0_9BACL|nr:hypothetical protein CVV65_13390 [Kyrpidia spormannii]
MGRCATGKPVMRTKGSAPLSPGAAPSFARAMVLREVYRRELQIRRSQLVVALVAATRVIKRKGPG